MSWKTRQKATAMIPVMEVWSSCFYSLFFLNTHCIQHSTTTSKQKINHIIPLLKTILPPIKMNKFIKNKDRLASLGLKADCMSAMPPCPSAVKLYLPRARCYVHKAVGVRAHVCPHILLLGRQARNEKIFCRDLCPHPGKALFFVS